MLREQRPRGATSFLGLLAAAGQPQREARASPANTLDIDLAAVQMGVLASDGQAEA
jgi:hypothetical protein